MAAPRRALASSLQRASNIAAAHTPPSRLPACVTASFSCSQQRAPLSTNTKTTKTTTQPAWRLAQTHRAASPRATAARWYSTAKSSEQQQQQQPASRKWDFADVEKQIKLNAELEKSGAADGKVVFVDVREPHELHQTGKIPGAINIPITTAVQSFHIPDEDFEDLYGFQRPDKDTQLVFYCKAGVRAKGAAALAQHAGWSNIGDYPGSWIDWESQKGPVEAVKKQFS